MQRRDVLKRIGMASVIGVSGIVAYACKSNSDDEAEEQAAMDAAMKDSKKTVLS